MKTFRNLLVLSAGCVLALATVSRAESAERTQKRCQIMDVQPDVIYNISFGYTPYSSVSDNDSDTGSDIDMIEMDADWDIAYLRNVWRGDVTMAMAVRATVFPETADEELPNQLVMAGLNCGWAWRYVNDVSLRVRAIPGLYSDLEANLGESFNVPVSFELVKAFGKELSGVVGLQYRYDFDRDFMPLIGVVWEPNEALRIDLRCPETRITCYMAGGWNTHLCLEWDSWTYAFENQAGDDSRITVDYRRAYWGITARVADQAQLTVDFGTVFDREVRIENGPERDLEIENDFFLRLGLGAPF